jgi:hypothetical protein
MQHRFSPAAARLMDEAIDGFADDLALFFPELSAIAASSSRWRSVR